MEKIAAVKGHAYRPTRNPINQYRGFIAGCECGEVIAKHSVTAKTARSIHTEHKKAIIREQSR